MTNERYVKSIHYKAALDAAWKNYNPVDLKNHYDQILKQAKLIGFKILRNSKGEHKVINSDNYNEKMDWFYNLLDKNF